MGSVGVGASPPEAATSANPHTGLFHVSPGMFAFIRCFYTWQGA